MMICIGGVCVPLNLLIPFLIGLLHRYGYLQWFKQEWVTISYWKKCYARWTSPEDKNEKTAPGESREKLVTSKEREEDKNLRSDNAAVNQAVDSAVHRRHVS